MHLAHKRQTAKLRRQLEDMTAEFLRMKRRARKYRRESQINSENLQREREVWHYLEAHYQAQLEEARCRDCKSRLG
jgi:hypothetical protein